MGGDWSNANGANWKFSLEGAKNALNFESIGDDPSLALALKV